MDKKKKTDIESELMEDIIKDNSDYLKTIDLGGFDDWLSDDEALKAKDKPKIDLKF